MEHTHSIIIIKNEIGEYLQYFDTRWDSYLFPNCKLTNENHKQLINQYLIQNFNFLTSEKYTIEYVMDKVHTKFSESAKIDKEYHHYFYSVELQSMPDFMQNSTFSANDKTFKWFSLTEMLEDKRIQQVNSDIVSFIKDIEEQAFKK